MAKREIPEIDKTGELLEEIEQAEKKRRILERQVTLTAEAHRAAKKAYDAACQECYEVSGRRIDEPLFNQKKHEGEDNGGT